MVGKEPAILGGQRNCVVKTLRAMEEKRMFIWNYFIDLIKKKTCSICGKKERLVIWFKGKAFCVECYKNMAFSQKNKEWREEKRW